MDFGPTGMSGGPGLWEIEPGAEGPMHGGAARRLIRDIVGTDDAPAVGDLDERAGVPAGPPDRAAPLPGAPGVDAGHAALRETRPPPDPLPSPHPGSRLP